MAAAKTEIGPETLPDDVRERAGSMLVPTVAIPDEGLNFTSLVSQLERELILRCLEKTGGNKRQAARLLNLSRTTFIDKLHRLNLERGSGVDSGSRLSAKSGAADRARAQSREPEPRADVIPPQASASRNTRLRPDPSASASPRTVRRPVERRTTPAHSPLRAVAW